LIKGGLSLMKFKTKLVEERFKLCHPKLQEIMEDLSHFCEEADEELVITESMTTKKEDDKLSRKSDTHRTGRAVDLRVRDWDSIFLAEFIYYANSRHKHYGAEVNGEKRFVVIKSDHLHCQLNRSFTMPEIKEDN
jgi:hypothetical protein